MSGNDYGNLGNDMKAMKDGRASLIAETAAEGRKRKAETDKFMADTNAANAELKAETHQLLADADKMMGGIRKDVAGLKAETHQLLADADKMMGGIRKDVAGLKAETSGFLAQTGSDNAKLRGQTHKMLAHAHAETKAQARQVMVETKAAVGGILAEAGDLMQRLCTSSRQRAAGWRDVLRTVRGNPQGTPARASVAGAVMERPARTKPKGKKKASAKKD